MKVILRYSVLDDSTFLVVMLWNILADATGFISLSMILKDLSAFQSELGNAFLGMSVGKIADCDAL